MLGTFLKNSVYSTFQRNKNQALFQMAINIGALQLLSVEKSHLNVEASQNFLGQKACGSIRTPVL